MNQLALYGGDPVRKNQYLVHNTIIDDAEEKEVIEILRNGHLSGFSARKGERFLGGLKVREFEENIKDYFKVKHCVTFNSATSALHASISAAMVGPGDEVITSPFTMSATATSIIMQNGIPVFADIEDKTYGLDPQSVLKSITPNTKAILTVNLFGHPSKLDELKKIAEDHNLILIEDNSQSPGAKKDNKFSGTYGQLGILSFNYHKIIQTGEGGAVITDDDRCAHHLKLIRNHGEVVVGQIDYDYLENIVGWNYRLSEIHAGIGIHQFKKLDYFISIRQKLANLLTKNLHKYEFLIPPKVDESCSHVYYLYPMRFIAEKIGIKREIFVKAMAAEGLAINSGYVHPIYLDPMYQKRIAYGSKGCPFSCPYYSGKVNYLKGLCPTTERLHEKEIMTTSICKYPNSEVEIEEFIEGIEKILENITLLKKEEA